MRADRAAPPPPPPSRLVITRTCRAGAARLRVIAVPRGPFISAVYAPSTVTSTVPCAPSPSLPPALSLVQSVDPYIIPLRRRREPPGRPPSPHLLACDLYAPRHSDGSVAYKRRLPIQRQLIVRVRPPTVEN